MSWNPSPTIGSASWSGNQSVATKNQLLSTSAGIINNIALSTVSTFETLTVNQWISTPLLYVSDIKGYSVDISGLSSVKANFSLVQTSSLAFTAPTIDAGVKVSVDFNLGDFVWNTLVGTGAILFETAVGIGIGAGATFVGIGNGIAALVNTKDPTNPTYINTSNFEVVGSSTQLQVSTLGNAYPAYSSIMRIVSSITPNQQPGVPGFTSTIFYPGQICIRSISDPIPIVTSSSNVLGSTLQQFGEWVPLLGLEPEDIVADSVSTNAISTNTINAYLGTVDQQLVRNYLQVGLNTAPGQVALPYQSDVQFELGSGNYANLQGQLQSLYVQTPSLTFTQFGTTVENASLTLGTNGNESYLKVSSIFSRGNIQANSGFFSSLTVENLVVISTINTTSTNVENITSTATVIANSVFADFGAFSTLAPFQMSSVVGNPYGPFDITKNDFFTSTTYESVSSLQQNILSYTLSEVFNDEATFNIGPGSSPPTYTVTPQNVDQWASTILIMDNQFIAGLIDLGWVGQWATSLPGGATFDVLYAPGLGAARRPFVISENSNQNAPLGTSSFVNAPGGDFATTTYRFTLPPVGTRNGWWTMTTPAGAPYASSNTNTFQIFQDINDTYIRATDRLHIQAGDIFFDGTANFSNYNTSNVTAVGGTFSTLYAGVLSTNTINASNVIVNPLTGGFDSFFFKPSTLSFLTNPTTVTPLQMAFNVQSPDYVPSFTLLPPFMGSNAFTSYNYTSWNGTVWNNQTALILGPPKIFLGDVQTSQGSYAARFWINNDFVATPYALPIYTITSSGSNQLGFIPGGNWGLIQTTDGSTWTLNSNVPNPQGTVGGNFSNIVTISQTASQTTLNNTQNIQLNAPNTTMVTGSLNLYADQIRVNSRRYGSLQSAGLPSFPIGIENTVYIDPNISWTYNAGNTTWESDATNALFNINNTIFYDANSWIVQVIPSRFRTNNRAILSWDVQPTILPVSGGGYSWGYNRYIQVGADPGSGANNWNWVIAFPKNYCTYE